MPGGFRAPKKRYNPVMARSNRRAKAGSNSHRPSEVEHDTPRWTVAPFYGLAFFSGVAALIYELTWVKMLSLTFGSTTLSAAAVIAAFMGGMGLGARLYHRLYARAASALVLYALLEIAIALSAAMLTRTFYDLPKLLAQTLSVIPPGIWLTLTRFAVVFVLLMIPAMLMGATFPALCTVVIGSKKGVDRHLGMIYGINTIGAACGVLLAGLVIIERLGLTHSVTVAIVINLAVGITALALAAFGLGRGAAHSAPPDPIPIRTFLPRRMVGVVLFVSGFATLSYEILWFRGLSYATGHSTYALTIVLATFLIGLGLGSLLLRRVLERQSPERDIALCQCLIAVLALGAMACVSTVLSVPGLRDYVSVFSEAAVGRPWWWRLVADGALASVVMLPATLFMGLSFPLATRLYLGDVRMLGAGVGGAYLLANLGSILGSLAGSLVLLPMFGTIGGTKVVAIANLAVGMLVWAWDRAGTVRFARRAIMACAPVVVLAVLLPSGLVLRGEKIAGSESDQVFVEEGDVATVQVLAEPGRPDKRTMTVNGVHIGWSDAFRASPFYRKQVLLAHLPMVLDTRIRNTLNIGLGSATTLNTLAPYPELLSLDCVEISASVVRAAKLFSASSVLKDPRVHLIVDDAVHYLLRSNKKYDAIISDGKQDPFFSGNANLLCREFYRYALEDLTEDGLFVQWFPLPTLGSDFRVVLRTLCDVFPFVEVFYFPRLSVFVVASKRPLADRPGLDAQRYQSLPIGADLAHYYLPHPAAIRAHWTGGKQQLLSLLANVPISTWDRPILDFSAYKASREEWRRAEYDNIQLLLAVDRLAETSGAASFDPGPTPFVASTRLVRKASAAQIAGQVGSAQALLERAVQVNPEDPVARAILGLARQGERRRQGGTP